MKPHRESPSWVLAAVGAAAACLFTIASGFAHGDDLVRILRILTVLSLVCMLAGLIRRFSSAAWHALLAQLEAAIDHATQRISTRQASWMLVGAILVYTAAWSLASILRHQGLNSSGFDLAIQHQVLWNLAHGRGFESSIEVTNYLGDHVALTLPLFAPLLWIWDDVRILLVAQSLVLGLGAWPVYRIARHRCESRIDGLFWSGIYLLTPAVGFMNKYDFHDLVLALPVLLAGIDAVERGRLRVANLWLALALLTREEVGLAVAGIGIWAAVARGRRLWGIGWAVGSIGWAIFALFGIIPHFRKGAVSDTLARYHWLGESPLDVMKSLLTRPWILVTTHYHRVRRVLFPLQLLLPLAGMPLLSLGRLFTILPNLGLSIASSAISQNSIYFQYNAPILPALFWAGIAGFRRITIRSGRRGPAFLLMSVCLLGANFADPALWKNVERPYAIVDGFSPRPNRRAFAEARRMIPEEADLLASNNLAPHLSARRRLAVFHLARPNPAASWIVIDLTDTRHLESSPDVAERIEEWIGPGGYKVVFYRDGIVLLSKGGPVDPVARAQLQDYVSGDARGSRPR